MFTPNLGKKIENCKLVLFRLAVDRGSAWWLVTILFDWDMQ